MEETKFSSLGSRNGYIAETNTAFTKKKEYGSLTTEKTSQVFTNASKPPGPGGRYVPPHRRTQEKKEEKKETTGPLLRGIQRLEPKTRKTNSSSSSSSASDPKQITITEVPRSQLNSKPVNTDALTEEDFFPKYSAYESPGTASKNLNKSTY